MVMGALRSEIEDERGFTLREVLTVVSFPKNKNR
jgi:hypothetical protein